MTPNLLLVVRLPVILQYLTAVFKTHIVMCKKNMNDIDNKDMNNSIFKTTVRMMMIVFYHQCLKTACCMERGERETTLFMD